MLENKIFQTILAVAGLLILCVIGSGMIKFMPLIGKILGFVVIGGGIWLFIKFIRRMLRKPKEK